MSQLEQDLLSRVLRHPEELKEVLTHSLTDRHFRDPSRLDVFKYIMGVRRTTGKVPSPETVARYTGFTASDPPETAKFYCLEMVKRATFYALQEGVNTAVDMLNAGNVYDAVRQVALAHRDAAREAAYQHEVFSTEAVELREERYDKAKARGGEPEGWPMPWEPLTKATMGWRPSLLGLIAARTGVGKTMQMIMHADCAWSAGAKVTIISPEMSPQSLQLRHDAYVAQVPMSRLLEGTLSEDDEAEYRRTLGLLRSYEGIKIVGHNMAATVPDVIATIERTEPDILFIDSLYLVRPTHFSARMSRNDRLAELGDEMATLANDYKIPIVGCVQINRQQKKGAKEVDTENIYGTDVFGQHASIILGMVQYPEDKAEGSMHLSCFKNRDGLVCALKVRWDFEDMVFDTVAFEMGVTMLKPARPPVVKVW
jgi:replicative DNA helicase